MQTERYATQGWRRALVRLHLSYVIAALAVVCASCHHVDDKRLPVMPVNITFNTVFDWNSYGGVNAVLDTRRFIREQRVPAVYPYTANTYTGFGGVLLVCDLQNRPLAYDLACPVECRSDVRVDVDTDINMAVCPKCHSVYDIFSLYGQAISGEAADRGYGLTRYSVAENYNGMYRVIRN